MAKQKVSKENQTKETKPKNKSNKNKPVKSKKGFLNKKQTQKKPTTNKVTKDKKSTKDSLCQGMENASSSRTQTASTFSSVKGLIMSSTFHFLISFSFCLRKS